MAFQQSRYGRIRKMSVKAKLATFDNNTVFFTRKYKLHSTHSFLMRYLQDPSYPLNQARVWGIWKSDLDEEEEENDDCEQDGYENESFAEDFNLRNEL